MCTNRSRAYPKDRCIDKSGKDSSVFGFESTNLFLIINLKYKKVINEN